ncbi:hypothetical protein GZ77_00640 [Endozoicomonas montiporae]|uniref:Porin n=2 Tax=Endozoicomonas montiporae TaxID=1027273 RepID=A0A081N9V7_9GAMM|nr:OprD family outer membrane porin [Endozoicomonas montiporae]AMO57108.1 OprD family porin [Endozoicomonas montiporae CL-33]KEQ15230.1 hypothetical protein GZ77_00640 [Endozoicomonas montiporae]
MKLAVSSTTSTVVLLTALSPLASVSAKADDALIDPESNDHHLSLKLRNYFQDRQLQDFSKYYYEPSAVQPPRKVKTHNKQQAWGQGLELNFESAWLGDRTYGLGIDASFYGGVKLIGSDDEYGTTILKEEPPVFNPHKGLYTGKQDSYGKPGQLYLKGFAGQDRMNIRGKAGWIPIEKPLLHTHYRLTPTRFQGAMAEAELGDFELYGAWTDRVSIHNHDKMEKFTSLKPGKEGRDKQFEAIDHIYTLGGSYNHESGLGSDLAYAESESYLKLYHANLNYTFSLSEQTSLLLEGQYYKGQENGNKWKSDSKTYGGFDKDANLYNFNARLTFDMLSFMASYSQVEAKKNGALGEFDYHLAYDSARDFDDLGYRTKRQISSFNHNGESVWQAGVSYAFDNLGLPGLSMGYTYTAGKDIEATNKPEYTDKYKENEHNVKLGYAFQQKALKGLSVTVLYAQHEGDKELSEMKNENKKDYRYEGKTDLRVFVDYTLSVF